MSKSLYLPLLFSLPAALAAQTVVLDPLVVTASPVARPQTDLIGSASVLEGDALQQSRQPTLGETLSALPGVSATGFGPGASRPILRGLGANRVRILANSTDTLDASNTSPDHAVSVEPFLVKRIEVVRGPAALLHGSSAVGGVVNVIDHRIESELPAGPVSGLFDTTVTDNGAGHAVGGALDIALAPDRENNAGFVLHLDGFQRESDDLDVPGASGQPGAPRGTLLNSSVDSKGASAGLSYVSAVLDAGVNYSGFDTFYGVPQEPDISIDLRQRRFDASADYQAPLGVFSGARAKFGYADYEHREIDVPANAVETVIGQEGFDGRFELLNDDLAGWAGALGAQLGHTDLSATGDEAFLPTHGTDNGALFIFQELPRGDTVWQLGARVEHREVSADAFDNILFVEGIDPANNGGVNFATSNGARSDDRTTLSGSFGAIHTLDESHKLAWSVSYTERAPTGQELYADGPHIGTDAYEIGDASLDDERALGAEVSLRRTTGLVTGSLTGFATLFDGYIFEQGTGNQIVFEDPDGIANNGDEEALDEIRFVQRDALFYGVEAEAVWHLHAAERHSLDLTTAVDYTRAVERGGDDLPRIPPLKARVALDWRRDAWRAGVDLLAVAKQGDTAPGETDTDGYALLGLSAGYTLETTHATYDVFLRASNLTDEEARQHTSFVKNVAPLAGRAFTAGVRVSF
ncbi:MAG: TonB-dependent receptor [Verrucomicrobiota bacterium]